MSEVKIHIEGKSIEDIFCLPCIESIHKDKDTYHYHLYNGQTATVGDWLCQNEDGEWYVAKSKPQPTIKRYIDKYPDCVGCPVSKYCGTMISSIRLCNSYELNGK